MAKRPTQDAWESARRRWEADSAETFESIGKAMGVSRAAVSKRANDQKDPWTRPQNMREIVDKAQLRADAREVAAKVTAKVAAAVSKVAAETRKEAVSEVAIDIRADVLERHRADWSEHRKLFTLQAINDDFEAGKSAKISAEMLSIRQKGERAAYGLDDVQPSDPAGGRQLSDLEIAAKMAYFVDLGRRRKAELEAG